ncbi:MAG: hypothetical protein ACJ0FI_02615 [Gammaproteobacteria bacterium]
MAATKKRCPECRVEFTISTLQKYGGICGKCEKKLRKEMLENAPSLAKNLSTYFISMILAAFLTLILIQYNSQILPMDYSYNYIHDYQFANNEFSSKEEMALYKKIINESDDVQRLKYIDDIIKINPYKSYYIELRESANSN